MSVLVIGGGFAGWAACWGLVRRGLEVEWLFESSGASGLYSGALDYRPWNEPQPQGPAQHSPAGEEPESWLAWLRDFGGWLRFDKERPQRVVSSAGIVRPAFASDACLLDLQSLVGKRLAVVDLKRPGWHAEWFAQSLRESDWARSAQLQVGCLQLAHPEPASFAHLGDADLCGAFEQAAFHQALVDPLREGGGGFDAFLFGPWLGQSAVAALWLALKRPVGETLSEPGQGAGLRYDTQRDHWARGAGVSVVRGRLLRLEPSAPRGWHAHTTLSGRMEAQVLGPFEAAILCTGGLVGGGLEFHPDAAGAQRFAPSYQAPVEVAVSDSNVELPIGPQRSDLVALGLAALERAGLQTPSHGASGRPPLAVAGAALAGRPRTALGAIESGLRAASAVHRAAEPSLAMPAAPGLLASRRE